LVAKKFVNLKVTGKTVKKTTKVKTTHRPTSTTVSFVDFAAVS